MSCLSSVTACIMSLQCLVTAHLACAAGLRVKGKQTHVLCKLKTLCIATKTASYKVLLLGNNVCRMDSICFLICCPLSDTLAF